MRCCTPLRHRLTRLSNITSTTISQHHRPTTRRSSRPSEQCERERGDTSRTCDTPNSSNSSTRGKSKRSPSIPTGRSSSVNSALRNEASFLPSQQRRHGNEQQQHRRTNRNNGYGYNICPMIQPSSPRLPITTSTFPSRPPPTSHPLRAATSSPPSFANYSCRSRYSPASSSCSDGAATPPPLRWPWRE